MVPAAGETACLRIEPAAILQGRKHGPVSCLRGSFRGFAGSLARVQASSWWQQRAAEGAAEVPRAAQRGMAAGFREQPFLTGRIRSTPFTIHGTSLALWNRFSLCQ
jgi:hypothetical protein